MVDPRMAQATAVHTKIATIATIRFNMIVCASTLSAVIPPYPLRLALSSTFPYKVRRVRGSLLFQVNIKSQSEEMVIEPNEANLGSRRAIIKSVKFGCILVLSNESTHCPISSLFFIYRNPVDCLLWQP